MIDMHQDLLSIMYYCELHNRYDYLEEWIKNFNFSNVSGVIANLYYMSKEEMRKELGDKEIDVFSMFMKSTLLFNKYLPNCNCVFSIEGCDYIEDVGELEDLYNLGLRNILLVWNEPNKYGSGNRGDYGLTDLGKEFLIKAIDLGISIDLSHMNKKTFYDTIELIKSEKEKGKMVKVIASHSNCFDVYNHERNLDDSQLKALKSVDGILGLVGYSVFVGDEGQEKYLEHVMHAVDIMGIDNVGVSSDDMTFALDLFNEDFGPMTFKYDRIKDELTKLLSLKFQQEDVEKILYKNVYNKLFKEEY